MGRCCKTSVAVVISSHSSIKGVKPRVPSLDDPRPPPDRSLWHDKNSSRTLVLPPRSALNTLEHTSPLHNRPCPCRCVAPSLSSSSASNGGGGGGWAAPQFRRWLASYLRELKTSPEAVHRALVLRSARPLLEADPALGLSVFLDQQRQGPHHGRLVQRRGGGVQSGRRAGVGPGTGGGGAADGRRTEGRLAPHDVVSFLKAITPSEVRVGVGRCGLNRVHFGVVKGSEIQHRASRRVFRHQHCGTKAVFNLILCTPP